MKKITLKHKKVSKNSNALIAVPRTSGLQASITPPKAKRETNEGGRERERHTFKGKGECYNMPQNPTLPPKSPRSGVTFHYFNVLLFCVRDQSVIEYISNK